LFISLSKVSSHNYNLGVVEVVLIVSRALIYSLIHISKVDNAKIASLAFLSVKLASSNPSPDTAIAILVASAPNSSIIYLTVKKFPSLLDIFFPSTLMYPLQKYPLGHNSGSFYQTAA
jgi:hypothetical protein